MDLASEADGARRFAHGNGSTAYAPGLRDWAGNEAKSGSNHQVAVASLSETSVIAKAGFIAIAVMKLRFTSPPLCWK